MRLHGYWRSSASWRVRIALALKGLVADPAPVPLRDGAQRGPDYLALNPQGLVPALSLDDGTVLAQSLAICEYLDEIAPSPPLLPADPVGRAQVRALAQIVACDIHPIQNLRILNRLREFGHDGEDVKRWAQAVIADGLDAYEQRLAALGGRFSFGDVPGLADICLVPQLGNARRFGVELRWPRIAEVEAACLALPAFADTAPERQPDAE